MHWLIVESQLADAQSHHLSYLASICAGARAKGVKVEIASRVDTAPLVAATLPVIPVLHDVSGLAGRGIGAIRIRWLRQLAMGINIARNALALCKIIGQRGPHNQVLCLTTALPQLITLALVQLVYRGKMQPMGALFVDFPILGERPNLRMRLLRWLIQAMGPNLRVLAATHYAQRAWQQMLGVPVHYVVFPVELPEAGLRDQRTARPEVAVKGEELRVASNDRRSDARDQRPESGGQNAEVGGPESETGGPVTSAKPLVFGFYGFARHEQGVDVLMKALEILHHKGELKAEFRILWPNPFRMPDGSWLGCHQFSHLAPKVKFLPRSFTPDKYEKVLGASDWVLLPYRWRSYAGRISMISIEACVLGIPVIYTKGTDAEEVVSAHGAGIGVKEEDAVGLADAICEAIKDDGAFRGKARERRKQAREVFSGRRFVEQVCQATSP